MKIRAFLIVFVSLAAGFWGYRSGLSYYQAVTASIFCISLLGTLAFWELRLSFVFFGAGLLLITRAIDLENLLKFASLDVILFLIGMMILVSMLNEAGLIYWIIMRLLRIKNITGKKLFLLMMGVSAVASALMGEVASIIIMTKVILEVSDFFDIDPIPLIISTVLATNIGSAATVLGNPIGVLIAARGKLTFEDFIFQALPVTIVVFALVIILLIVWFRKNIKELNEKLHELGENKFFLSLITIPADKRVRISLFIFVAAIMGISLHKRLELVFGLEENTLLMMLPIFFAGIVLLYRRDKMRYYVEHGVEWASILFFLFLFAQAGTIKYSGISDFFAKKLIENVGTNSISIFGIMLYSSGILSGILDNTVVVASYVPIVQSLGSLQISIKAFWWAILFGACFGGNITAIGSTANIVALDILEKERNRKISFLGWLKVGLVVGILSMAIAYLVVRVFNF